MSSELTLFRRQRNVLDPTKINPHCTILGCGSLGSWTAMILAKLGIINFTLIDFDTVGADNLANQAFRVGDISESKVSATACIIQDNSPIAEELHIIQIDNKIDDIKTPVLSDVINTTDVYFLMTDNVQSREALYDQIPKDKIVIDARTGSESFTLFTLKKNGKTDEQYKDIAYCFQDGEAEEGDCSVQSVGYSCAAVASMAVNGMIRHLREEPFPLRTVMEFPTLWLDTLK